MSRDTAAGLTDQPWLFIEPDPASLTTLCTELGVSGVQIEQLSSMDESILRDMRPVYGLILLVRHKPERALRDDSVTPNSDIFFANQVVPEAYALYAILHVLMNGEHVDPVDIGPQLSNFKDFTAEFPPMLKGLSVTNSKELKGAHNNVARRLPNEEDTVSCHSITYIPFGGYLWELDGFKRGPLRLAPCTTATWFETARLEIQRKIDIYQRQQIPISVWTVIQDRRLVYQRRLFMRNHLKTVIEQRLDACDPDWRSDIRADQWEDEYAHAMDNERRKRNVCSETTMRRDGLGPLQLSPVIIPAPALASPLLSPTQAAGMAANDAAEEMRGTRYFRSLDDLPDDERQEVLNESSVVDARPAAELRDLWLQTQDDALTLFERLNQEHEKYIRYKDDTIRRQHDYTPFIRSFIERLIAHGHLQRMVVKSL